jgi:protein-S-isoprenylcysteine O-methyltransferase
MKLLSRIALLFVVVPLLILLARGELFSRSPVVILAQIAALALLVWARTIFPKGQFRPAPTPPGGPLLTRGPYRLIRHPMYAGAMLLLWSSILGHWSPFNAVLGLVGSIVVAIRITDEERALFAGFPEYAEYARRTKRLVPYVF